MSDVPLEVDSDPVFQRREWVVQRVAWALLALLIAVGLSGALGDGPLASAHERSADGSLDVRFDRFTRKRSPATISVTARPVGESLQLWISRDIATKFDLKRIEPEPSRVSGNLERLVYEFQGTGGDLLIALHVEPRETGQVRGAVGIVGGPFVRMNQFVFP